MHLILLVHQRDMPANGEVPVAGRRSRELVFEIGCWHSQRRTVSSAASLQCSLRTRHTRDVSRSAQARRTPPDNVGDEAPAMAS